MSYDLKITETWDGKPISKERPYGVTIVVYKKEKDNTKYLVLHRGHKGTGYEGRWAWGPPAGARLPYEDVFDCACRELVEETGLLKLPFDTGFPVQEWKVYSLEVDLNTDIKLSDEHDEYKWVNIEVLEEICLPRLVFEQVSFVKNKMGL